MGTRTIRQVARKSSPKRVATAPSFEITEAKLSRPPTSRDRASHRLGRAPPCLPLSLGGGDHRTRRVRRTTRSLSGRSGIRGRSRGSPWTRRTTIPSSSSDTLRSRRSGRGDRAAGVRGDRVFHRSHAGTDPLPASVPRSPRGPAVRARPGRPRPSERARGHGCGRDDRRVRP